MRTVKVGIWVDHLRLYPESELHASHVATLCDRAKTSGELFFIYEPVAESCAVAVAGAKPTVVKHEGIDAESLYAVDGIKQAVTVKGKVHSLPAIENNRAARVDPTRVDDIFTHKVMVTACHAAHSLVAVAKDSLGRFKALAGLKLPIKALGVYTHRQAGAE